MSRRTFRVGIVVGLVAGAGVAVALAGRNRRRPPGVAAAPVTPAAPVEPVDMPIVPAAAAPSVPTVDMPITTEATPDAGGAAAEPVAVAVLDPEDTTAAAPEPTAAAAPEPDPQAAADEASVASPWVVPFDGGSCPVTHPVKAKLASGIFHLPGMAMYGRTRADRCYRSPEAAEADGLRRSTR